MEIGMLWWDNSKTPLRNKLQKAMDYHRRKYGAVPTLAFVHPSMHEEVDFIKTLPDRHILPGSLWIGVES